MTRVLVLATGAVTSCMLPHDVHELRRRAPGLELRVVLTRSACRFVSREALALVTGAPVLVDVWDDPDGPAAPHVELAAWAEAFVIHPATAHTIARLSAGLCDTPVVAALAATRAPVGIAPSLPPGMLGAVPITRHLAELAARSNVVLTPPRVGRSASSGELADGGAGRLVDVLKAVGDRFFATDPEWAPVLDAGPEAVPLVPVRLAWTERGT